MNSTTIRRLSAPCGLDCFNCEVFEENITEEMKNQFALKIKKDRRTAWPEDQLSFLRISSNASSLVTDFSRLLLNSSSSISRLILARA